MKRLRRLGGGGRLVLALTIGGAVFGIATAVQASIPDSSGVIHACRNTQPSLGTLGAVRVVDTDAGQACRPGEVPLVWNQKGPTGARGPTGAKGATGAKGVTGGRGPTGAKGATGGRGPTGAKGSTGAKGPTGTRGPTGPKGATGPTGPASLAALQGSPCTVNGTASTLNVTVDPATGAVSLVCTLSAQLVMTAQQSGGSWGFVSGSGLKPGAEFDIHATNDSINDSVTNTGFVDGNGTIPSSGPIFSCGFNWHNVYTTSTAADGSPITSNVVNTPCG